MRILLDIPDNEVPKTQEVVTTYIHFIDGEVCEVGHYGFMTLPKNHGDLIDRDVAYEEYDKNCLSWEGGLLKYVSTVIPAERGDNK